METMTVKKSIFVLALLGAVTGTATAQSSVTLYGLVDVSYQNIRSGHNSALGGASLNRLADGSTFGPGSRWGIRAAEDLGSGLKSNVVLESGFFTDVGSSAQGGRLFGRQAFISLASTSLGEIRLGRQYIFHDEVTILNNPYGNATILNTGAPITLPNGLITMFIDAPRIDNAVQYLSPVLGGFRVQAMVAAGEGVADRYHGLKASYVRGPLNIALSYEQSKSRAGRPASPGTSAIAAGDGVNKIVEMGGNYDFGAFKVFGGYQQGKDLTTGTLGVPSTGGVGTQITSLTIAGLTGAATELKAYTAGLSVPFGSTVLAANYTRSKFENSAGAGRTLSRIGLGAHYNLSKLTSLYAAIGVHQGDLREFVNEKTVFQLGMRKAF